MDGKPIDLCRAAVEVAPEGDRYPTAFSAVVALVRIGLSDAEIITDVILPYLERFDQPRAARSPNGNHVGTAMGSAGDRS